MQQWLIKYKYHILCNKFKIYENHSASPNFFPTNICCIRDSILLCWKIIQYRNQYLSSGKIACLSSVTCCIYLKRERVTLVKHGIWECGNSPWNFTSVYQLISDN